MKVHREDHMRVAAVLSSVVVLISLAAATAASGQADLAGAGRGLTSPPFYINREARFAVMFPGAPAVKDIKYTAKAGAVFPARQFTVQQGMNNYSVTFVDVSTGPAVDTAMVDKAVDDFVRQGKVVYQSAAELEPGVGSRQLMVSLPDGRQIQGSVYMWDHRLYITEVRGAPGQPSLLRFAQSITLLQADGGELSTDTDRGGPAGRGR